MCDLCEILRYNVWKVCGIFNTKESMSGRTGLKKTGIGKARRTLCCNLNLPQFYLKDGGSMFFRNNGI
jgi:hypothetical protein